MKLNTPCLLTANKLKFPCGISHCFEQYDEKILTNKMTEKGYEGDQSSSSWDIPGPSSLAAILDTVYTSSASDNPPRNGKYIVYRYGYLTCTNHF